MKKKLLLVSFDAVGSDELDVLRELPNFKRIFSAGSIFPNRKTVFISNTYPVHASIATGVVPGVHGLISNTMVQPENEKPWWNYDSRVLKAEPIWDAAAKKGLKTGAVMWPVTAYAKNIRWNIPEIMARDGESQVAANLRTGSKLIQIYSYLRHKNLLRGIEQPERDRFATASMLDIIKCGHPDLMLMHLTAYDSLCHEHGRGSEETMNALREMDGFLDTLASASGFEDGETAVIVFSDHAQLNVHTAIDPNRILEMFGFLDYHENGTVTNARAFFQNQDGSAFCFNRELDHEQMELVKDAVLADTGVERLLNETEMKESGYAGQAAFGICAKRGYYFKAVNNEKATHGYPTDYPDYDVFFAISETWPEPETNSILEVTKAAKSILGI
ncbi:MAG: alkaline phosphatase family protein [Flexilinea sp.]|nr:alkaline phosphatase family protein [Flexilinea sp.]